MHYISVAQRKGQGKDRGDIAIIDCLHNAANCSDIPIFRNSYKTKQCSNFKGFRVFGCFSLCKPANELT